MSRAFSALFYLFDVLLLRQPVKCIPKYSQNDACSIESNGPFKYRLDSKSAREQGQ